MTTTPQPTFKVLIQQVVRQSIYVEFDADSVGMAQHQASVSDADHGGRDLAELFANAAPVTERRVLDVEPANDAAIALLPPDSLAYAVCQYCETDLAECDCVDTIGWPARAGLCSVCGQVTLRDGGDDLAFCDNHRAEE